MIRVVRNTRCKLGKKKSEAMFSALHLNLQFGCFFGLSALFKIRDMSKDFSLRQSFLMSVHIQFKRDMYKDQRLFDF